MGTLFKFYRIENQSSLFLLQSFLNKLHISGTNEETMNSPGPVSILGDRGDKLGTDSFNRTKRFTDVYNNNTMSDWNAFTEGK